jgi:hypothetical protein
VGLGKQASGPPSAGSPWKKLGLAAAGAVKKLQVGKQGALRVTPV